MKKIEDDLKNIFHEEIIPQIAPAKLEELNTMVRANKKKNTQRLLKPILVSICCVIVFIGILIPIINRSNTPDNPSNPQYYSDTTATKKDLNEENTKTYIENNYPKYNIMFEKCNYKKSAGYYSPNADKLLALSLTLQEINFPNTMVVFLLVVDNQFIYGEKISYTDKADIIESEDYILYKRVDSTFVRESITGYFEYNEHSLYLTLDKVNEELFNIFL